MKIATLTALKDFNHNNEDHDKVFSPKAQKLPKSEGDTLTAKLIAIREEQCITKTQSKSEWTNTVKNICDQSFRQKSID